MEHVKDIIILVALLIIIVLLKNTTALATTQTASEFSTPEKVIQHYKLQEKVTIKYVTNFSEYGKSFNCKAFVRSFIYTDVTKNTYTIFLQATQYNNTQKMLFLHELGHIIEHEYQIDLDKYIETNNNKVYKIKKQHKDIDKWMRLPSESFAEDFKVFFSKKHYNIDTTNTTLYKYNRKAF